MDQDKINKKKTNMLNLTIVEDIFNQVQDPHQRPFV